MTNTPIWYQYDYSSDVELIPQLNLSNHTQDQLYKLTYAPDRKTKWRMDYVNGPFGGFSSKFMWVLGLKERQVDIICGHHTNYNTIQLLGTLRVHLLCVHALKLSRDARSRDLFDK